jgi:hypothetical protein
MYGARRDWKQNVSDGVLHVSANPQRSWKNVIGAKRRFKRSVEMMSPRLCGRDDCTSRHNGRRSIGGSWQIGLPPLSLAERKLISIRVTFAHIFKLNGGQEAVGVDIR